MDGRLADAAWELEIEEKRRGLHRSQMGSSVRDEDFTDLPGRTRSSAKAIIKHFEKAHEAYVNLGARHPGDHDAVIERYRRARDRLTDYLIETDA